MMRKLRENTKWIMLITALAFVGLMVFEWGMDFSGRSSVGMAGGEIGRVNGEAITYEEYITVYRGLYQQQQQAMDGAIPPALNRQIENSAWDQVVMRKLIEQELRRRGIRVTAAEIRQAARFSPPAEFMQNEAFQTDGRFDLSKYHAFLASPVADDRLLAQLESYYRELIPQSRLYYLATAGTYVSDPVLWRMYRDANERVSFRFVAVQPELIIGDAEVTVSDAEIRTFYRENQDRFRREASAVVRYIGIDRTPSAADTAAARDRALALRAEIERGESFAELARRESADISTGVEGGQLSVRRGETVLPFEEAVFSQALGRVGEPVLTQFGYHLILVESREADAATARHILIPIALSPESEDRVFERADSLERLGERLPLAQAAESMGLAVQTGNLTSDFPFLPGVGIVVEGSDWALQEAAVGEVSPVFESEDAYYMIELVSRQEAGVVPLRDATADIRPELIARKKVELAQRRVQDALRAGGGEPLERVATAFGTEVRQAGPVTRAETVPGIGRLNAATGTAFGMRPGQVSDAVAADGVVAVIQLLDRQDANRTEWELQREDQRRRVTQTVVEQRWSQFMTALRDDATIVDNRNQLLRRGGGQDAPLAQF